MTAECLGQVDPRLAMIVIPCSADKARGGMPPGAVNLPACNPALLAARARVLDAAPSDTRELLPAWRRYQGRFYRSAGPALTEAAQSGHVVIISGGYGVADAGELIGWYDKVLLLSDWPAGVLESALTGHAWQAGSATVVAFAARTSDYARLVRQTPWKDAGLSAVLVSIAGVTGGAQREVPRRLGLAFAAFWGRQHGAYPPGTTFEQLA